MEFELIALGVVLAAGAFFIYKKVTTRKAQGGNGLPRDNEPPQQQR